ncbi:hypothetical protein H4217_001263 [Coemansia sp. RSA 1939]|nr:hypothetical protein H4217_001263 [Coemansia sp. RSA 1939]KAJ2616206.1 hypothetical protein EV177_001184 [Coemansia sp. RSA 1804]KAJ2688589.1 hypothetical protein GGH99_003005 [Coemansia sp. RSA 1285]
MAKHDFFSPKAVANRIKAKGLQKLRWYCQMCEKQCRDENGFKCHCASEAHQRQMAIFAENPDRYMEQFSQEFEDAFLSILSRRYGTKKVLANQVYQEIVSDRQHLHMNATKWDTLTEFVMHLGRSGKCKVEEAERGWLVEWVDTSPEALARRAAIQKKERQEMDDEQRERMLLNEQLARVRKLKKEVLEEDSKQETIDQDGQGSKATGLNRDHTDQPIVLALKPLVKKKLGSMKLGGGFGTTLKTPVMKKNAFKAADSRLKTDKPASSNSTLATQKRPETALERIMRDEQMGKKMQRSADIRESRSGGDPERRRSQSPESRGTGYRSYSGNEKHEPYPTHGRKSRSPRSKA